MEGQVFIFSFQITAIFINRSKRHYAAEMMKKTTDFNSSEQALERKVS